MTLFIVFCLMAYGLSRLAKFAKNNPAQTMQAAAWLKQMFK